MMRATFLFSISLLNQPLISVADSLVCFLHSRVQAQTIITEVSVPTPLEGIDNADVYAGANNSLHIVGTAITTDTIPNGWDGFRMLFVYSMQSSDITEFPGPTSTTLLPDTAWYWFNFAHGEEYRLNRSTALDSQGNVILFWTKQYASESDLPPYERLGLPIGKCAKITPGAVLNIFELQRSASPALCVGPDNTTHFVWESIRSVRSDSNCAAYSSQLFYRNLTASGQLTDPQPIDTGFTPRVSSEIPGLAHIVWLRGDSSTASGFSLRYMSIDNGTPTPIITLKDSVYQPVDLAMAVDSAGVIHVGWIEVRPTNQLKVFLLSFNGTLTTIDSSMSYSDWRGMLRLGILPNGVVDAIWSASEVYSDTLYYMSTRTNPPFNSIRTFSHPAFSFVEAQALFTKSTGHSGSVLGDTQRMRYLGDLETDSDSTLVLLTGKISRSSLHPAAVDANDNVWVAYGKNTNDFDQLGLARFTDQTTSVDEYFAVPTSFRLQQNYPNPFNPSTAITFSIPRSAEVSLKIFNLLGEEVVALVSGLKDAGTHTVEWDATGQPSGVYLYRLRAGEFVETRKLLLVR